MNNLKLESICSQMKKDEEHSNAFIQKINKVAKQGKSMASQSKKSIVKSEWLRILQHYDKKE